MTAIRGVTLTVRFLCELGMLAGLASWGVEVGEGEAAILLGVGAPLAAAAIWGLFVAPKARLRLPIPARLVLEDVLFGAASVALVATGEVALGVVLAAFAFGSSALNAVQEWRGAAAA